MVLGCLTSQSGGKWIRQQSFHRTDANRVGETKYQMVGKCVYRRCGVRWDQRKGEMDREWKIQDQGFSKMLEVVRKEWERKEQGMLPTATRTPTPEGILYGSTPTMLYHRQEVIMLHPINFKSENLCIWYICAYCDYTRHMIQCFHC